MTTIVKQDVPIISQDDMTKYLNEYQHHMAINAGLNLNASITFEHWLSQKLSNTPNVKYLLNE